MNLFCSSSNENSCFWVCDPVNGNPVQGAQINFHEYDAGILDPTNEFGITNYVWNGSSPKPVEKKDRKYLKKVEEKKKDEKKEEVEVKPQEPEDPQEKINQQISEREKTNKFELPSAFVKKDNDIVAFFNSVPLSLSLSAPLVFTVDDRKLYKPKEKVIVKGFLRIWKKEGEERKLVFPEQTKIKYQINDSRSSKVKEGEIESDENGSFVLNFEVPDNINLGNSTILFTVSCGENGITQHYHSFEVQEFRKPEFEVNSSVVPSDIEHYFEKDKEKNVLLSVNANYYSKKKFLFDFFFHLIFYFI